MLFVKVSMIKVSSLSWRVTKDRPVPLSMASTAFAYGRWAAVLVLTWVNMAFLFSFWAVVDGFLRMEMRHWLCQQLCKRHEKPPKSVWGGLSWWGRARLLGTCDLRGHAWGRALWGSKPSNSLFGSTDFSVSSKLRTYLFLTLILSSATKCSWRPVTCSVHQGWCWGHCSSASSSVTGMVEHLHP